jgi:glycosyltransferase involved in cell wall biosynthesis
MGNTHPQISVVIPCLRKKREIHSILASVDSCLRQKKVSLECILVSNLLDAPLEEEFRKKYANEKRAVLLQGDAPGVNRARHLGAEKAQGKFLFFLDDDCLLPSDIFLFSYLESALSLSLGSVLGGGYRSSGQNHLTRGYNALVNAWIHTGSDKVAGELEIFETANLVGGNFMIPRDLYFSSPLDPAFVYGGDETEFFRRIKRSGKKCFYSPGLSVIHQGNESLKKIFIRSFLHGWKKEEFQLSSESGVFQKYRIWLTHFQKEKFLIIVSLLHFPALFLGKAFAKFKQFA